MTSALVVDLVTSAGAGYRDLYYRWEHEQWEAGKIDLSGSAAAWDGLDAFDRRLLSDAINWRRVRSELAATALVAFVDSAPIEEQQVFLTTQLADEARAGVFLDLVADEVLGAGGSDMAARSASAGETVAPELIDLLERSLPQNAAGLRAAPQRAEGLVEGVAAYHLGVVGMLGLTELRALLDGPAAAAGLAGMAEGLRMMERDAARHVAFGLLFLADATGTTTASETLARALTDSVAAVLNVLGSMARSAPGLGTAEELQARATEDLTRWLRAVKLRVPAFVS